MGLVIFLTLVHVVNRDSLYFLFSATSSLVSFEPCSLLDYLLPLSQYQFVDVRLCFSAYFLSLSVCLSIYLSVCFSV